jgi:hypothetical protein
LSDGLFSEASSQRSGKKWSAKGKAWRKLADLRAHFAGYIRHHAYSERLPGKVLYNGDTAWEDLEIVVVEVREREGVTLPVSVRYGKKNDPAPVVEVVEPTSETGK